MTTDTIPITDLRRGDERGATPMRDARDAELVRVRRGRALGGAAG